MPYTRKRVPRKRKYVKRKRVPTNKQLATRVKKLEHTDELKYHDTVYTASVYNNTTTFVLLSNMGQGDNVEERLGLEATAKYINFKIRLIKSASIYPALWRIIAFWDVQANGAAPGLLASANPSTGLLDDNIIGNVLLAPHNYRTKERYKVLMDKQYTQNPYEPTVLETMNIKKNFKLGGAKLKYGDTGTTVNNQASRALYVWAVNANDSGSANANWILTARLWYTDS